MKRYTHLTMNGVTKNSPKNESVIMPWITNLIEEINLGVREVHIKPVMEPTYSYIDQDEIKGLTGVAIIETGYLALRIWEEEDVSYIHLDMLLSSPLPVLIVLDSIAENFGMYDASYMILDRSEDFKVLDYKSYP